MMKPSDIPTPRLPLDKEAFALFEASAVSSRLHKAVLNIALEDARRKPGDFYHKQALDWALWLSRLAEDIDKRIEAARSAGPGGPPRCRYCHEPVAAPGMVHAGGCGNVG